jgi:hypothetical protein
MAGLAIVYGLGGLLGYALITAVTGGSDGALGAVVEGMAGQALLRAQIDRLGVGPDRDSRSVLTLIHTWIVDFLEVRAKSGLEQKLRRLSDPELIGITFDTFWRHVGDDDDIDPAVAAQLHQFLLSAARELKNPASGDEDDARGRLRGFCFTEIEQRRLPNGRTQ